MRPVGMELALIEEVGVRRNRGRPKKRQSSAKACPRAEAKKLSVYGSHEKCLDALAEPVEAIRTDMQIVESRPSSWDSEYVLFLDSLREVENHLLLECKEGDGETKLIAFQGDDEPLECSVTRTKKKKKKSREMVNAKIERTFGSSKRPRSRNERVAKGLCNPWSALDIQMGKGDMRRGHGRGRRRKTSVSNEIVELEAKSSVSRQRKIRSNRQPIVEELKFKARKNRSDKNLDMEDYMSFLMNMMDAESDSSIIPRDVLPRHCKEKPESSSDSDIIAIDDHPFSDGDNNPFVAAKNFNVVDVDEEYGASGQICNSRFRKELMEALKKPYSEQELYKLSCDASIQTPKIRVRELRNGRELCYKVDDLGKSYLHHAPDFKRLFMRRFGSTKFKSLIQLSLKDRHRALNLLRGLFFYYENVVHDDVFKPWMDAECLKTMPSMSEKALVGCFNGSLRHSKRRNKSK